jgi:hypothetical protein
MVQLVPLERVTTQTLLGIRFWDRLTHSAIGEGLRVTAQRLNSDRSAVVGKLVTGWQTPSGVIAFKGLALAEQPRADTPSSSLLWETIPPAQEVVVDITDEKERFVSMSFVARLPFRGVFRGEGDWLTTPLLRPVPPTGEAIGVQLWSGVNRPLLPGLAAIRGQLVVGSGLTPASYALVRVQQATPSNAFDYFGMADRTGNLLLPLPYPPIPDPPAGSTTYPPLDRQTFPLRITVQFAPNLPAFSQRETPDLEQILSQPPINVGGNWASGVNSTLQFQNSLTVDLSFDRPLLLGTALASNSTTRESVLRLEPSP